MNRTKTIQRPPRLQLARQTLRILVFQELVLVAGGGGEDPSLLTNPHANCNHNP